MLDRDRYSVRPIRLLAKQQSKETDHREGEFGQQREGQGSFGLVRGRMDVPNRLLNISERSLMSQKELTVYALEA